MFVRHADEATPSARRRDPDPADGTHSALSRLGRRWSAGCARPRAEAVWVGWGFVAERPEFVDLCERLGIVFVGPSAAVMRKLGDKIESKLLAERAGVPVAPWSGGPVETIEAALRAGRADRLSADGQGQRRAAAGGHPPRRSAGAWPDGFRAAPARRRGARSATAPC